MLLNMITISYFSLYFFPIQTIEKKKYFSLYFPVFYICFLSVSKFQMMRLLFIMVIGPCSKGNLLRLIGGKWNFDPPSPTFLIKSRN